MSILSYFVTMKNMNNEVLNFGNNSPEWVAQLRGTAKTVADLQKHFTFTDEEI